ncbi:MAG: hypothetical protein H6733_09865 [Alphaproteobacteria bacterium]|nr:hypothetical protein [Alphaproteobacteria bacterium]
MHTTPLAVGTLAALLATATGCGGSKPATPSTPSDPSDQATDVPASTDAPPTHADVTAVEVTGAAGAYTFSVTVHSPDTGCDRYADWWEVVRDDGTLAFRRILNHSHPSEQPFRRSGAPIAVQADETLWVRAHLHPGGYGGAVLTGTAAGGFAVATPTEGFAAALETVEPLPVECLF